MAEPPSNPGPIAPVIAQRGPYEVELEGGKTYLWCACGRSQTQPFCDGSHAGTGLTPVRFEATSTGTVFLCGCKQTGDRPFCDGTHDTL
jgi:CDGSH-type Zn-finger protein